MSDLVGDIRGPLKSNSQSIFSKITLCDIYEFLNSRIEDSCQESGPQQLLEQSYDLLNRSIGVETLLQVVRWGSCQTSGIVAQFGEEKSCSWQRRVPLRFERREVSQNGWPGGPWLVAGG